MENMLLEQDKKDSSIFCEATISGFLNKSYICEN
jgi:hypothetical protein